MSISPNPVVVHRKLTIQPAGRFTNPQLANFHAGLATLCCLGRACYPTTANGGHK